MMKNIRIILAVVFSTVSAMAQNVYQLPNGGMEQMDANGEPTHWSSFLTSNCTISVPLACSMAQTNKHAQDSPRPGSAGSFSLKIYSNSIMGVNANGMITTGRVNAGSTTASDPSNNTQTIRSNADFCQPFHGTPDSLYFWVKYSPVTGTSLARFNCYLHGNNDFRDPVDGTTTSLYCGRVNYDFGTTSGAWVQKKLPFIYDGGSTANYMLITTSTCNTPGGCDGSDNLWFDDIEFIYSAWLTDIRANGTTINNFTKGNFNYEIVFPRGANKFDTTLFPTITWTKEASDAGVHDTLIFNGNGIDSAIRVLTVTAEDGVTIKTYSVRYVIWKSPNYTLDSLSYQLGGTPYMATIPTQTPDSAIQHIYIGLPPGTALTPSITGTYLADTGARATFTQPTSPRDSIQIAVRAENGAIKTYKIHFYVILSDNAFLHAVYFDNVLYDEFDSTQYTYNVSLAPGTILPPNVTATPSWSGLVPLINQPLALPGTSTIVVTAENGATKTYTFHFTVGLSTNAKLQWLRYNGVSVPNFHADTLNYTVELRYGVNIANVTASLSSSLASLSIVQAVSIPGTATITVTAQDTNYKRIYTVHFLAGKSNVASLSSLQYILGNDTLGIPNFNPLLVNYHVALPSGTTQIPQLIANETDTNATLQYTQPLSPNDTGRVKVTAEDDITTQTYRVIFTVALSTNAELTQIEIDGQNLSTFVPSLLTYTIVLDSAEMPVVAVQTADTHAVVQIIYPQSIPGQIHIIVVAEDTNVKRTYRINLSLSSWNNPNLLDLGYSLGAVNYPIVNFHQDTLIYYVVLPSQTAVTPIVTYQTADMDAYVSITQPISPNGAAIIFVTSYDSTANKIYHVYFSVEISDNSALDSLFWDGFSVENFSPNTLQYNVDIPYNLPYPTVNAVAQSPAAQVFYSQAQYSHDSAVIMVLAEDLLHSTTYVIHFIRQLSPVNTLSALGYTLNGADSAIADFSPLIDEYIVDLKAECLDIPLITYTLTDNRATATLLKTPQHPNDTAIIMVVAQNQTDTNYYTIIFNRLLSANTHLTVLQYNGENVFAFHPDTLNYTVILAWDEAQIPSVSASAQWNAASVQLTQPTMIYGSALVRVVAEDGIHFANYSITFLRAGNASLHQLGYTFEGNSYSVTDFDSASAFYEIHFPIGTTALPTIDYVLTDSRSTSVVKNVTRLDDTAKVEITAWDNSSQMTYYVHFILDKSTDASLLDLRIDGISVDGFEPQILAYSVQYPYGYVQMPVVSAVASQIDAKIEYQQITQYPQTAYITVYAGDTNFKTIYSIDFSTDLGNNTYLASILLDSNELAGFDKNITHYDVEIPYNGAMPYVFAVAQDSTTSVNIIQANHLLDTVFIQTQSLNGNLRTYWLTFYEAFNTDANLAMIYVDGDSLPNFSPSTANYPVLQLSSAAKGEVTATTTDRYATYQVIDTMPNFPKSVWIVVTAANQTTTKTYRVRLDKTNSVDNIKLGNQINVYPNPADDILTIELPQNIDNQCNIIFYNAEGKIIATQGLTNIKNSISLQKWAIGTYFYSIIIGDKTAKNGTIIKK